MAKLTARTIDALWREGDPGRNADADCPGLYFKVTGPKAASWVLRYQLDRKRVEMGLGPYPSLSLAEARDRARAERRMARVDKIDPLATRRAEQSQKRALLSKQRTISQLADEYAEMKSPGWAPRTPLVFYMHMRLHVFPVLGNMLVKDVTVGQIRRVLEPIWLTKPATAVRVQSHLSSMFDYAEFYEMRQGNPAKGITKFLPKQPEGGHHNGLSYEDIPQFVAQLRQYQNTSQWFSGRCNPIGFEIIAARKAGKSHTEIAKEFGIARQRSKYYSARYRHRNHPLNHLRIKAFAVEFLLLTGALRTSEILGILWEYIDETDQLLVIPRKRMKVKTGDDHIIPLTARPMAIINEMKAIRRNDYLFPGHGYHKRPAEWVWIRSIGGDPNVAGAPLSQPALWDFIKNELGYEDITTHGFRRTFKNWATQRRFRDIAIEFCLDHKYGTQIENVYRDERLLDERRELLQAWSDYCDGKEAEIIKPPVRTTKTA
jgi:integrase